MQYSFNQNYTPIGQFPDIVPLKPRYSNNNQQFGYPGFQANFQAANNLQMGSQPNQQMIQLTQMQSQMKQLAAVQQQQASTLYKPNFNDAPQDLYSDEGFKKLFMTNEIFLSPRSFNKNAIENEGISNILEVIPGNPNEQVESWKFPIFQVKKRPGGMCSQYCMTQDCRDFQMEITHAGSLNAGKSFIHMQKDCSCSCCQFFRPEVAVQYLEEGDLQPTTLGYLQNEFSLCNYRVAVQDDKKFDKFIITCDCPNWGVWAGCLCVESCLKSYWSVQSLTGEVICQLPKKLFQSASSPEYFSIQLPQRFSKIDRTLLLAAVIFIDFRYFDPIGV